MSSSLDIASLRIVQSKMLADSSKYFELFEKHLPRGLSDGKTVLLYEINNLGCLKKIIELSPEAKHAVVCCRACSRALKLLLDKRIDVEYVEKFDFTENDMKFDCIVMNPPYDGNLHLKILAEAIRHLKDEKSICVNLSPVRWLQDPLAKFKANNDYHRFEDSISKHIASTTIISTQDSRSLFGAELLQPLGIYKCDLNIDHTAYIDEFKQYEFIDRTFAKILDDANFKKQHIEKFNDNLKNFVLINIMAPPMKYGRPMFDALKTWCGVFTNGKNHEGLTYREAKNKNTRATRGDISRDNAVVFNTASEAENCYNAMQTNFVKFFVMTSVVDVHVHHNVIPWMQDYTQPWDDARFYKHFNITADEQKVIEETMKKYIGQ